MRAVWALDTTNLAGNKTCLAVLNISGDETEETKVAHYILGPFLRGVKGGGRGPSVWARVCHDATRDTRFPPWTGRCVGRKAPLALKTGHPNMLGPEAI